MRYFAGVNWPIIELIVLAPGKKSLSVTEPAITAASLPNRELSLASTNTLPVPALVSTLPALLEVMEWLPEASTIDAVVEELIFELAINMEKPKPAASTFWCQIELSASDLALTVTTEFMNELLLARTEIKPPATSVEAETCAVVLKRSP